MIELQTSVKQDDTTRTRTPKPGYLNLSIIANDIVRHNRFREISANVQELYVNREFKLHVSRNGKRQVRTFLVKCSYVFVSYFLSYVERVIMHCSFKTASSFTLYCLMP
jgi:hypothetical protein